MPGASTTPGPGEGVEEFVAMVRQKLEHFGASSAAMLLDRSDGGGTGVATVVVVGEPSTGKSSLVNELVGQPWLLPEDADVASGTYCTLQFAAEPAATVHFVNEGEQSELVVEPEEVVRWAHVDASPRPSWVEVRLPEPRLQSLALVDTPGVGGLDSSLGDVTLQALKAAGAVVFVTSCQAPLGRAELEFLRKASESIEHVVFVVTKVDSSPGWAKVVDEDVELIAEHAPRFASATFIPVSVKWARDARSVSSPAIKARLAERSGIAALWAELESIGSSHAQLSLANRLRLARSALEVAYRDRSHAMGSIAVVEQDADQLETLRRRVEAWQTCLADWQDDLAFGITGARNEVAHHLTERRRALLAEFQAHAAHSQRDREAAPRQLVAGLSALGEEATEVLRRRLEELWQSLTVALVLDDDVTPWLEVLGAAPEIVAPVLPKAASPTDPGSAMPNITTTYLGGMMAHVLATQVMAPALGLAALGAATPLGWGIAAGFGVIWAVKAAQGRARAADRAALVAWAASTINDGTLDLQNECNKRLDEAYRALIRVFKSTLPKRLESLRGDLAELELARASSEEERALAAGRIKDQLEVIQWLAAQTDRRLGQVRAEVAALPRPS
ncbi:MAG TPA: dynamin family protein [Acidimicrobiales bacterium]|nr:dynamin family protein [Acidimicrobiales bacterium]